MATDGLGLFNLGGRRTLAGRWWLFKQQHRRCGWRGADGAVRALGHDFDCRRNVRRRHFAHGQGQEHGAALDAGCLFGGPVGYPQVSGLLRGGVAGAGGAGRGWSHRLLSGQDSGDWPPNFLCSAPGFGDRGRSGAHFFAVGRVSAVYPSRLGRARVQRILDPGHRRKPPAPGAHRAAVFGVVRRGLGDRHGGLWGLAAGLFLHDRAGHLHPWRRDDRRWLGRHHQPHERLWRRL